MMRLAMLVTVLVACKGGGETSDKQPAAAPPKPVPPPKPVYVSVPASESVVPLEKLPSLSHVVWIDGAGALSYARLQEKSLTVLPEERTPVADLTALVAKVEADIEADAAMDPTVGVIDYPEGLSERMAPMLAVGRVPSVVGERGSLRRRPLVMAPRDVPATVVIGVLASVGGRLGVTLPGDRIGALRYAFREGSAAIDDARFWYEAHIGTDRIEMLELIANERTATTGDTVRAQLAPFVTDKGFDLLFAPDVRFQRLVEILLAVDDLGVTMQLGLGPSPGPIDKRKEQALAVRNEGGAYRSATAILSFGQPNVIGDLPKTDVRTVMNAKTAEFTACYDDALARKATLRGMVLTQYFVTTKGTVSSVDTRGLDPAVASCVTKVIKTLVFPPPRGGGGAQVSYPIMFRPIET